MDFDPDTSQESAVRVAEGICAEVLPSLPRGGNDFFRDAHDALGVRGLFDTSAVNAVHAARIAMTLAARSSSLALAFAIGYGFERTIGRLSLGAASQASLLSSGIGIVAFGRFAEWQADADETTEALELDGEAPLVRGGLSATRVVLGTEVGVNPPWIAHLDMTTPGLVRVPSRHVLGFERIPACSVRTDGVRLEPSAVLAQGDLADSLIRSIRDARRTLDAAIAIGIGRRAFRAAVEHLRTLGSRPSQSTEFSLSDAAADLDAGELSVFRAAWIGDTGGDAALDSASAMLLGARAATRAAHTAIAVVGAAACTDELRQCYLDACALESREGTTALEDTISSTMLEE